MFNKLNAKNAGSKGGQAKTKAKRKAARVNGKQGGRPATRTLAAGLLGRFIHPEQEVYIDQAWDDMFSSEKVELNEFFQVQGGFREALLDSVPRAKLRRVPKRIKYLIDKFTLAMNHYLREVRMPKPYSVEIELPSVERQEAWERGHPNSDIPCPPRKVKIDVRNLPYFAYFESKQKRGETLTVEDLEKAGGGNWTKRRAEVAIRWLNATYPQNGC